MLVALLTFGLSAVFENGRWSPTEFVKSPSFGADKVESNPTTTGLIIGFVVPVVIGIIGLVISIIASIKCIKPLLTTKNRKDDNDDELDDIFDE